jgi:gluconate 2-dehydrogenase gamma chain
MANQGSDRREVLEMLAKVAAASQFPGFSRWVFGQQHQHAEDAAPPARPANFQPAYFSASEFRTIDVLTGLIIPKDESPGPKDESPGPKDESPGAQEAGVSEFIDFMAAHGEKEIQQPLRAGLQWLDSTAKKNYGANFAQLSPGRQTEILERISAPNSAGDGEGQVFFRLIRRYTVMGYYTSAIGMKELDFPGLRLYSESPACPHTNDPEHRHLPPPKF